MKSLKLFLNLTRPLSNQRTSSTNQPTRHSISSPKQSQCQSTGIASKPKPPKKKAQKSAKKSKIQNQKQNESHSKSKSKTNEEKLTIKKNDQGYVNKCQKNQLKIQHQLEIFIDDLEFIGCGLDHVVFVEKRKNVIGKQGDEQKVVIFKRSPTQQEFQENQNCSLKKQQNESFSQQILPSKQQQLQYKMQQLYQKIMQTEFQTLNKYRWGRQSLYISNSQSELDKIYEFLEQKISQQLNPTFSSSPSSHSSQSPQLHLHTFSIPNPNSIKFNRKWKKVEISRNIFEYDKFNTFIQFKPKSIVPDYFSINMVEKVIEQIGIKEQGVEQIKEILKNAPALEKIRWYKKTCLKGKNSKSSNNQNTNKLNENPFTIFEISPYTQTPNFIKTKLFKHFPKQSFSNSTSTPTSSGQSCTPSPTLQSLLNSSIRNQLHKNNNELLSNIHKIQCLFPYSPQYIDKNTNLSHLTHSQPVSLPSRSPSFCFNQQKLSTYLNQKISICLVNSLANLETFKNSIDQFNCISQILQGEGEGEGEATPDPSQAIGIEKDLGNLLLFLISLTWKDVSLVYRAKYDGLGAMENEEIWVIDDYLKNWGKVQKNVKKDGKLLAKYVRHKICVIKSPDNQELCNKAIKQQNNVFNEELINDEDSLIQQRQIKSISKFIEA